MLSFLVIASIFPIDLSANPASNLRPAQSPFATGRLEARELSDVVMKDSAGAKMTPDRRVAADGTDALVARVQQLEAALAAQRERELAALTRTNEWLLAAVGALMLGAVLTLAAGAMFVFRSLNRIASPPSGPTLRPPWALLPPISTMPARLAAVDPSLETPDVRMASALEQLQRRIRELEVLSSSPSGNANGAEASGHATPAAEVVSRPLEPTAWLTALLEKGYAHLNLRQAEAALDCFDKILQIQPTHTEALLKRGTALEKLDRLEEALASFNSALALDPTLTNAHLCKGGVCNRLARFDEAVRAYEEALRVERQQSSRT